VLVLVTCYGLTVVFDMVVAVSVGVGLAALLFMRRMATITQVRLTAYDDARRGPGPPPRTPRRRQRERGRHPQRHAPHPESLARKVAIYEIAGRSSRAAQRAMSRLTAWAGASAVIIRLEHVP